MMDYLDVKRDDINYSNLYGETTTLMANAARRLSEFISAEYGKGSRICAVCGTGNNAGDGIAALEYLREDYEVCAVFVNGKNSLKTPEAKWALKNYGGRSVGMKSLRKEIGNADIILDCLFGIGISGDPREPYSTAIGMINDSGKEIVSVDVPSGLGTGIAVRPVHTVTFTDIKRGMSPDNSGNIVVRDIGIPDSVRKYAGPGDLVYYPRPEKTSHKGMNGTLAIVGGWEYYGSAVIAGMGANRLATDLVRIYTTERNYGIVASYSPYLIVRNTGTIGEGWIEEASGHGAILVGPGMGSTEEAGNTIRELLRQSRSSFVVDADGIRTLSKDLSLIRGRRVVFTPHHREFRILTGTDATEENAVEFAKMHSCIIVLKGPVDIVTDGERTISVEGGNARMTMGGTGDLLAGLIAAAASRGIDPFRAAVMGSYINKKTAEMAFKEKSYWYGIDDMLDMIPHFMKENIKWASQ